jgi:TM2 domain-containing membrane protein YozV
MGRYYGDSTPTSTERQTTPVLNNLSAVPGAPPHPLDAEWFLHVDGQVYGPYTGHQLAGFAKEGRVDGASQVMLAGSDKWVRAGEEVRLAQILRPPRTAPTPPPISAAAGATVVQVTNTISPPAMIMLDDGLPFGPKSPGVALLLSLLLCGAGQMFCGRVGRGLLMLFGSLLLWVVMLGWIIWIWSVIDAYSIAKQMNLRYLQRMQAMQPR